MTISKITASVTPIEEAEKINEIITETNLKATDSTVVHLAGDETIIGSKTFKNDIFLGGVAGSGQEDYDEIPEATPEPDEDAEE